MSEAEVIHTSRANVTGLMYARDLRDALEPAITAADAESGEISHYVELEDGRAVVAIRVVKETLTDGSIACKLVIVADD
jgi:hypothetical protein